MAQDFERDEFDEIAAQGGPVGVHRAPRPWWSRIVPPLAAFVIAGLIAFAIAMILWNRDIGSGTEAAPTPTITLTPSDAPTTEPTPSVTAPPIEPTEEPEPSPEPTEDPEPVILYDAQVHVRNGASIQGLAGEQQELLVDAGYTNTEANNISNSLIPGGSNVVVYEGDRVADTAQDIANILGIDAVEGDGTPGGAEIEVLLATDPAA